MSNQVPRLRVEVWHLYMLLDRFVSVAELRTATGLPEAAIGQHLAILREKGLIDQEEREGATVYRRISASSRVVPSKPPTPAPNRNAGYARDRAVTNRPASSEAVGVADRSPARPAAAVPSEARFSAGPAAPVHPADRSTARVAAPPPPAADPPADEGARIGPAAPQTRSVSRRAALPVLAALALVLVMALVWTQLGAGGSRTSTTGEDSAVAGVGNPTPAEPGDGNPDGASTSDVNEPPTTPEEEASLQIESPSYSGEPFETLPIQGTYVGAEPGTSLRVQRQQDGSWVGFPLHAVTDDEGNFSTYVELGPGRYRLRMADVENGVVSDAFVLRIG